MNESWERLPALSLKQMQYFVTLARLRHFTDTAHRLAISQLALSGELRQIETVLGGKLINPLGTIGHLTERGALLLPYAERLLNVAQNSFEDMHTIIRTGGGGRQLVRVLITLGVALVALWAVMQLWDHYELDCSWRTAAVTSWRCVRLRWR